MMRMIEEGDRFDWMRLYRNVIEDVCLKFLPSMTESGRKEEG